MAELRTNKELATQVVEIFSNSHLVVSQVEGSFGARDPRMAEYIKMIDMLSTGFQRAKVSQISRGKNSHTNLLATLALSMDNCVP